MLSILGRPILVGIGYFLVASGAIAFTRFGGGFAILWLATPYLTAALVTSPRNCWLKMLVSCGLASALATGFFGLGWALAAPLAIVNMSEAAIASHLMSKRVANSTLDSLAWFGRFALQLGILAPAVGATAGSSVLWVLSGVPYVPSWTTWFVGHSLGSLTFAPIAILVFKGEVMRAKRQLTPDKRREAFALFAVFLIVTFETFAQSRWPLLFLPLGPLALICFRHDRVLPALAVSTLAIVGAAFTSAQMGPVALAFTDHAGQAQFFQFYLASVVMTILPITADLRNRRHLIRALRESEARFRVVLENSSDIVLHLRPDGHILYASPSAAQATGQIHGSLVGQNALTLVDHEWQDYVRDCHSDVLAHRGGTCRYEYMATTGDGDVRWFETMSRAVVNERRQIESVISVVRDIDARKLEEATLTLEVSTDSLTGLANRRAFQRAFEKTGGGMRQSIAMLDIDHFKVINDRFGHAAGDCALQTFAEVARRTVRKDDLIARLGGEEFAILFSGLGPSQASEICERLRKEMSESITFYGANPIHFTVSIGIAHASSPDLDFVLAKADAALYEAKREGRDRLKLAA